MKRFEELLRLFETRCVIFGACKPTATEQLNSDLADVTAARLALVEWVRERMDADTRLTPDLTCTCREKSDYVHPPLYCQWCGAKVVLDESDWR